MATENSTLECALYYISQGWAVLPLYTVEDSKCSCGRTDCQSPAKHPYAPYVPNGTKDATTNRQTVERWFNGTVDLNVGVCAGQESGLVLLDIDPRHGGNESLEQHKPIPKTLEVITGSGGRHLYFQHPGDVEIRNSAGTLGPGLDVRGHHGYVVAPPSKHICGEQYRWAIDPRAIKPAPCPRWIIKQEDAQRRGTTPGAGGTDDPIPEGERDNNLTSLAGSMRRRGMDCEAIYAALSKTNQKRCNPPLPDKDIKRIARSVSNYAPDRADRAEDIGYAPIIIRLSDVKPQKLLWLWQDKIPMGNVTLIVGHPGLGKSVLTMCLAAHVTKGKPWPDAPTIKNPVGSVILLTGEDSLADVVRVRLDAAQADVGRVIALEGVCARDKEGKIIDDGICFDIGKHTEAMESLILQTGDVRLIIIDPLASFMGRTDSHKNAEVRGVLTKLQKLAERHCVAVVGVTHYNKNAKLKSASNRIIGSIAFNAMARAVWNVFRDPDDPDGPRRLFLPGKNNLTKDPTGLPFELVSVSENEAAGQLASVKCVFGAEPDWRTPDDIFGAEESENNSTKLNDAIEWLKDALERGPQDKDKIRDLAELNGISQRTLDRAKVKVRVISKQTGRGDERRSTWSLP
ncbi:MAG: bifunctional DNA primase/polymerase [Planctomycetota bacterium]|jgi:hypothetical protein